MASLGDINVNVNLRSVPHDGAEVRFLPFAQAGLELRGADGESKKIAGYAAVFGSFSKDMGFRELIRPGAFARALAEKQDTVALFNHDSNQLLGRTSNGTAKVEEDSKGLRYEIDPPDTSVGRDVVELLKRGDLKGSSFAFSVRSGGEIWKQDGDIIIRELTDVNLYDVSVVTNPAYEASEVALRSLEAWRNTAGDKGFDQKKLDYLMRQLIAKMWD